MMLKFICFALLIGSLFAERLRHVRNASGTDDTNCPGPHQYECDGYCKSIYDGEFCNGVLDCSNGVDEESCDTFTCEDFVRGCLTDPSNPADVVKCGEGSYCCDGTCQKTSAPKYGDGIYDCVYSHNDELCTMLDLSINQAIQEAGQEEWEDMECCETDITVGTLWGAEVQCKEDEYFCDFMCVPTTSANGRCDDYVNCGNGYDELCCQRCLEDLGRYLDGFWQDCPESDTFWCGFESTGDPDCRPFTDATRCNGVYECDTERDERCCPIAGTQDCVEQCDVNISQGVLYGETVTCDADSEYFCDAWCIPIDDSSRCDNVVNCGNGYDEVCCDYETCPPVNEGELWGNTVTCADDEVFCDYMCMPATWDGWCDNKVNCGNGYDEVCCDY